MIQTAWAHEYVKIWCVVKDVCTPSGNTHLLVNLTLFSGKLVIDAKVAPYASQFDFALDHDAAVVTGR